MKPECDHLNADGTLTGGFDGCVPHLTACEGHSEEAARGMCGVIAQRGAAGSRGTPAPPNSAGDTGLSALDTPLRGRILTNAPTPSSIVRPRSSSCEALRAGSVIEFMVLPAGTHTCNFGQAGTRVTRTVSITPGAAQAQARESRLGRLRRPARDSHARFLSRST